MCLDMKGQDSSQNAAHIVMWNVWNGDQCSDTLAKWDGGGTALGYNRAMCLEGCLDVTARKHLLAPAKHVQRLPLIQDRIDSESLNTFVTESGYCPTSARFMEG